MIERVFAGTNLEKTTVPFREAHQTAIAIYRALHQYDKALAHLTALKRLDDEATKLATQTSNALMGARFDAANQAARIARLRDAEKLRIANEALQRANNERAVWLGGAGTALVVLALLLTNTVTLRRHRDLIRKANAQLAVTNAELARALAAKTEFLASTSHEIRTPLNGILGMAQVLLADDALAERTRERLTVIHGAGLTMRSLVDDILDVSKMETGNLGLEAVPFDLPAALFNAAQLWTEQAHGKGLAFAIDLAACPQWLEGDPARVRQIVFNLLSNALKFTSEGGITLHAAGVDEGVRIAVTDTGIGIAADKLDQVFEPFQQADASTTRKYGGTGLGLAICRSLARAMGGELSLESRAGEGSTFAVTLPLPTVAAPPAPLAADADATLLVVERNPITRAMFRALFAPIAGPVAFAGTADEATVRLAAGGIERVLVDDGTARVGGDAHGFVAAVVAAATSVPVVLLWPVSAEGERAELEALGVDRVVAKPVTGAALTAALFGMENDVVSQPALVSQAA